MSNIDLDTMIFLYATLSHSLVIILYYSHLTDIYTKKTIYLLGHIFISSAMFIRIKSEYIKSIHATVLGISGHSCLLLFFMLTFINNSKYVVSFDEKWLNMVCILGQLGMISIYYYEYNQKEKHTIINNSYVHIFTFTLLAYFYYRVSYNKKNEFSLLWYPLIMVSVLYLILLYKPVTDKMNIIKDISLV